ncbi:transposase family protein [Kitasatospora sp. NPDC001540]|uniref:transposase family protein n=1 Tax=Kitasatospora sp. NPDC001540 TaxID=3364014 RepID=UPI0036C61CF4
MAARAWIVSERRITGLSRAVIADLLAESGPVWQARRDAELCDRPRRRSVGAGAKCQLVFVDRLLATLVHLCHGATHDVLACWFDVDRSTLTRAADEIRPLLAERGCRNRFVSGKSRINPMKALVATDDRGRVLFCGEVRAGSVAHITQVRDAGLVDLLAVTIHLEILTDAGYQGLGGPDLWPGRHPAPQTPRQAPRAPPVTHGPPRTGPLRPLLRPHASRTRHRPPQELAHPRPAPWSPRPPARHRPSRRRTPLGPTKDHREGTPSTSLPGPIHKCRAPLSSTRPSA